MNTLQELRNYVKSLKVDEYTTSDHKDIYTYIEQKILNQDSLFKTRVPPLDLILYAIRNIMRPSMVADQIPDLLDLLAAVEFYRNVSLGKANDALVYNDWYKAKDERAISLTHEERTDLESQVKMADVLRAIYFNLILQYCQFDVYTLWSHHPDSMTDLILRMSDYFPRLNKNYTTPTPRLFLHDLSDDENDQLHKTGLGCCRFVRDSYAWAVEHRLPGQSLVTMLQSEDFAAVFPCPIDQDRLVDSMVYYLEAVESVVRQLEDMFRQQQL